MFANRVLANARVLPRPDVCKWNVFASQWKLELEKKMIERFVGSNSTCWLGFSVVCVICHVPFADGLSFVVWLCIMQIDFISIYGHTEWAANRRCHTPPTHRRLHIDIIIWSSCFLCQQQLKWFPNEISPKVFPEKGKCFNFIDANSTENQLSKFDPMKFGRP